jgi:hypothetical protein
MLSLPPKHQGSRYGQTMTLIAIRARSVFAGLLLPDAFTQLLIASALNTASDNQNKAIGSESTRFGGRDEDEYLDETALVSWMRTPLQT